MFQPRIVRFMRRRAGRLKGYCADPTGWVNPWTQFFGIESGYVSRSQRLSYAQFVCLRAFVIG